MDILGTFQGKLGKRVWLRSRTGKRIYEREWVRGPERRTEAQLRAMSALSSGTRAWRRLSPSERQRWRDKPPIRTMRRKNRDAKSHLSTGWNWFIGAYILECRTMQFAFAEGYNNTTYMGGSTVDAARITLPANHPHNLAVRAALELINNGGQGDVNLEIAIVCYDEGGLELWRETDLFRVRNGITAPWAMGFKYMSTGARQTLVLTIRSQDWTIYGGRPRLEVLY